MPTDLDLLQTLNPEPEEMVDGWSRSSAGRETLARVLEHLDEDREWLDQQRPVSHPRRPLLIALGSALAAGLMVAIPLLVMRQSDEASPPADVPRLPDVELGALGHLWPAEGRPVPHDLLVSMFAEEVLGWAADEYTVQVDPAPRPPTLFGRYLLRRLPDGTVTTVTTAGDRNNGSFVVKVGADFVVRSFDDRFGRGTRLHLRAKPEAVTAHVVARLAGGEILEAETAITGRDWVDLQDVQVDDVASVLIRYLDAGGVVIAADGAAVNDFEPEAPTTTGPEITRELVRREMEEAWQWWRDNGPSSHRFVFTGTQCECAEAGEYRVVVEDGVVTSVWWLNVSPQREAEHLDDMSIDGMFRRIQGGLDQGAERVSASYDRVLGYPTWFTIVWRSNAIDATLTGTITEFEVLTP